MRPILGRFDDLSGGEAKALLRALEGPLLEIALANSTPDVCSSGVVGQVLDGLYYHPLVQLAMPTQEEEAAWDRFRLERGDSPAEFGEFIYGSSANPWATETEPRGGDNGEGGSVV